MKLSGIAYCVLLIATIYIPFTVSSQGIYLIDDDKYAIVYLKSHTTLSVRTKFLDNSIKINDNLFEYYLSGDTIKQKWLSIGVEDFDLNYDSKGDTNYQHYPYYLSIKNNDYKISMEIGDSLLYDAIGRVRDVFNNHMEIKFHVRQIYITDNISTQSWECSNCSKGKYERIVSLMRTDENGNIVYVKVGIADSLFSIDTPDTLRVDFHEFTMFNYSKNRKRITSIQHFDIDKGAGQLVATQFFKYKRGRPVSSFERKEKTGKIVYQQIYTYSPVISMKNKRKS